jgi:hypothetical protein
MRRLRLSVTLFTPLILFPASALAHSPFDTGFTAMQNLLHGHDCQGRKRNPSPKRAPVLPTQERRSLQGFSSHHVDTHPLRAGFVWYNLNHGTWTDVLGCGSPAAALTANFMLSINRGNRLDSVENVEAGEKIDKQRWTANS